MLLIGSEFSALASIFKLIFLLIVFFALIYAAHLFTKWYAKSGIVNARSSNISIIESQQISPGKNIVIAKIGGKVVSFVLFKENAVFLTELEEEELVFPSKEVKNASFQDVFKRAKDLHHRDKES
jgi:flagellar biogenesis protein FliO